SPARHSLPAKAGLAGTGGVSHRDRLAIRLSVARLRGETIWRLAALPQNGGPHLASTYAVVHLPAADVSSLVRSSLRYGLSVHSNHNRSGTGGSWIIRQVAWLAT